MRKATDWKKIFTMDMYKLVFRIYTEFLQLNAKTFFKLEKYLDISQRIYKLLKSTLKMFNIISLAIREMKNKTMRLPLHTHSHGSHQNFNTEYWQGGKGTGTPKHCGW